MSNTTRLRRRNESQLSEDYKIVVRVEAVFDTGIREPLVHLTVGAETARLTLEAARGMAEGLLHVAEDAETDAFLIHRFGDRLTAPELAELIEARRAWREGH